MCRGGEDGYRISRLDEQPRCYGLFDAAVRGRGHDRRRGESLLYRRLSGDSAGMLERIDSEQGKTYEIPVGASNSTSLGVHFISNPKVLMLTLFNGKDLKNDLQILPPHNKSLDTYEELWAQYQAYYEYIIEVQRKCCNIQHDIWRKVNIPIWQSTLKPDCLEKGHHAGDMGFRYNATYNIETTGTINMVNSLAALKKLVYEEKKIQLGGDETGA